MEWAPIVNDETVNIALPAPTKLDPRRVAPSKNCTDPPGTKAPVTVTVAMRVTVWPTTLGFSCDVTTVEVACAKASPAPPTRPSKAVAKMQARRAAKIRFRTADKTQRNCRPLLDA
jgi:hypothetical protein